MQNKKNQNKDIARQERAFQILWLIMPLFSVTIIGQLFVSILENSMHINSGYAELIGAIITAPLAIITYKYAVAKKVEHRTGALSELKFRGKLFFGGIALSMLVVIIQLVIIGIFGSISITKNAGTYSGIANALGIAISAAITEELVSRGILFRFLEKYIGTILAVMASALIFGLPHMFNPHATLWTGIAISIQAGIMLALVYVVTRNLWATIGIHAGWNFSVALLGIGDTGIYNTTLSGPEWLVGSKYGLENSVVLTFTWLIVSLVFYILAVKRKKIVTYSVAKKQKHPLA